MYVLALLACFLINKHRLPMMFALTASMMFSLLRFSVLESVLKHLGNGLNKKSAIVLNLVLYIFNLGIIGLVIGAALYTGTAVFIAAVFGTLSVLVILMINVLTEALGITKNQFGQRVK